jgi:signal transduction histidine kinase
LIKAPLFRESLTWFAEATLSLIVAPMAFVLGLATLEKVTALHVALWVAAVLISELWLRRAATKLLKAPVETPALKVKLLLGLALSTAAWSSYGNMTWGVADHMFQGICMVLWMTQFMLAAVLAFSSRNAFIVGTIIPLIAMMFAVLPMMAHLDTSGILALTALCIGPLFAFGVSRRADRQRQRLRDTLNQLEQTAADAARAASAKSEFLANMSHELRTPLTAILGFSELLQKSKSLQSDDARAADRINTASRTLLTVVNDVLDFSKMEAGALELDAEALDPVRLMQDALDVIGPAAAGKGLTLRLEVTGAPVPVVGDPVRFSQVLFNLVNNALKFTSRGEIVGAVAFESLDEATCRVRFEVRDTGIGIPDDKRALMFERFSQADGSITRQFGGTGLGLAICKRIVTLMKGVIDVDSEPGKGSVFWLEVELPVADHLAAAPAAHVIGDLGGLKVRALVAEDHPVNQELLRLILETVGIDVHVVGDGAQAVDAYQSGAFDIILMDVQMPVMGGPDATSRIRALEVQGTHIPIIAMTANVMADQVREYLAAGMDAHIGKPIESSVLIETVLDWVARSRAEPATGDACAA